MASGELSPGAGSTSWSGGSPEPGPGATRTPNHPRSDQTGRNGDADTAVKRKAFVALHRTAGWQRSTPLQRFGETVEPHSAIRRVRPARTRRVWSSRYSLQGVEDEEGRAGFAPGWMSALSASGSSGVISTRQQEISYSSRWPGMILCRPLRENRCGSRRASRAARERLRRVRRWPVRSSMGTSKQRQQGPPKRQQKLQ